MSVTLQKTLIWAQKCLSPKWEFHPVHENVCQHRKIPCCDSYVSRSIPKILYPEKMPICTQLWQSLRKKLIQVQKCFSCPNNALLQNKIPVFTKKSILAYKSASFSHKNVCLHSQMPLNSQIWQSAQKTHQYKNDSSALKNSLVHTKLTAFAQKCLSGHKSASSKHKCIFILKYVCHSLKDPKHKMPCSNK